MHLKKLQLLGFKSFADETTLEFGPGITAVVGPNGSGKSNIVDAMLWALGERSSKALRGHAATDVIFNGASGRKPTGLAEVSLFFDNEDGVLPTNFKEVQVSRRLFRDGQSEYGLCGSKCRLRDVLDLFLDTGVGPDAGCIISQGEIDAILSAKPEDRRGLIEGAAGVQKYHSRRTETRRRLDKVDADLTRVRDITSELADQIEPLAGQAEIAREYDSYAARLHELQLAVLLHDLSNRREREANLLESQKSGRELAGEHRTRIENLERLENIGATRARELEAQVETLSNQLTEAVSKLGAAQGQIGVLRERRRALSEQQEFAAREIGVLRARATGIGEDIAGLKATLANSAQSHAGLNESAAQAEAKLGEATAKLSEATRELQTLQARQIEAMRLGQTKREAIAGARAEAGALENRLRELENLRAEGEKERSSLANSLAEATKQLEELRERLSDKSALETARKNLENAREFVGRTGDELNRAREARARLQSRAGALRELEESLEGVQGGARAILSAVKRGEIRDDYTLVADAIRAPQELELAIETALGAGVHNLICPDDFAAREAVGFLKSRRAGRATFLPLSSLRAPYLSDRNRAALNERAVLGLASELVEARAENQSAVDYLLGRVLIVETLEDATRLAKKCDSGVRLVTLEGDLVLPGGAITGGAGKAKTGGLLARKRELDELEAREGELESQIEKAKTEIETARGGVASAENELKTAQESRGELQSAFARQEREVETVRRDLGRNKNQIEAVEAQIRATRDKLAVGQSARDDDETAIQSAEAEAKKLESAVEAARALVGVRSSERDQIAHEVGDVRAKFGAGQERLQSLRRALGDLERAREDALNQIRTKNVQIERASGEDAKIVAGESELVSDIEELGARRETLEKSLQTARGERAEALEKAQIVAADLKTARAALSEAEDELHRVEVRLAATQTELADIERRLTEEFASQNAEPDSKNGELQSESGEPESERDEPESERDEPESENGESENESQSPRIRRDWPEPPENFNRRAAQSEIEILSGKIAKLGGVNLGAVAQYDALKERLDFLDTQARDLETARDELLAVIAEVDGRIREQFLATFSAIQTAFAEVFAKVFGGGATHLALTDPANLLETGVELRVQMPGKAAQDISLLSGGERALTALAFMMAILKVRPAPFVILDEVDAPLDQSNVGRFTDLLREFTDTTQFIVITHNNGTMQAADVLYGVTQQEAGVSTLMSVRLTEDEEIPIPQRNGVAVEA